eukprot:472443_1
MLADTVQWLIIIVSMLGCYNRLACTHNTCKCIPSSNRTFNVIIYLSSWILDICIVVNGNGSLHSNHKLEQIKTKSRENEYQNWIGDSKPLRIGYRGFHEGTNVWTIQSCLNQS